LRQRCHVGRGDLVRRRVLHAADVAGDRRPVGGAGALRVDRQAGERETAGSLEKDDKSETLHIDNPQLAISKDLRMVMTSRLSSPMTNWRGRLILSAPVSAPPRPLYCDCSSDGPLKPIDARTVATRGRCTTPVPIATVGALQPPPLAFLPP